VGLLLFYIKTFEQKLYKSHEGLRLIYVGGITHRKGLHHIKQAERARKDNAQVQQQERTRKN